MHQKENDLLQKIENELVRRQQNQQMASTLSPSWNGKMAEIFSGFTSNSAAAQFVKPGQDLMQARMQFSELGIGPKSGPMTKKVGALHSSNDAQFGTPAELI